MNENVKTFKISDNWFIAYDKDNNGIERAWDKYMPYNAVPTKVPSIIAETLPDCHGVAFYFCKFTPEITVKDKGRLLLKFGAADYKADVYLNGGAEFDDKEKQKIEKFIAEKKTTFKYKEYFEQSMDDYTKPIYDR